MPFVTELRESAQYDGTNGTALAAWLDGTYSVVADTGARLVLQDGEGSRKTVTAGGWLVRNGDRTLLWHGTPEAYAAQWTELS